MVQQVGERQCRQSLLPDIPTEGRVPVVLDSIVCSATNVFSNVCPLVAKLLVALMQDFLFLRGPGAFLDGGIKLIMPPLTALFSVSAIKV